MIRHWLTMAALIGELRSRLSDAILLECYRNVQGESCFRFEFDGKTLTLVASLEQPLRTIYMHMFNPPHRRERIFPMLWGKTLMGIAIAEANRVITLEFDNTELLILAIPGKANCLVRESGSNHLIATIKIHDGLNIGQPYDIPSPSVLPPERFSPDSTIATLLQYSTLLLAEPYADAFCNQHGIETGAQWHSLSKQMQSMIIESAVQYRQMLINQPRPVIARLQRDGTEQLLLDHISREGWDTKPISSVAEGVLHRVRRIWRTWTLERNRSALYHEIKKELKYATSALERLNLELIDCGDADRYELWGNMLVAHPERRRRGLNTIECSAWDGTKHTIPLDERRTVLDNAECYFALAKKMRRTELKGRVRHEQLQERLSRLLCSLKQVEAATSLIQLKALSREVRLPQQKKQSSSATLSRGRFRQFSLPYGYILLVGKDARSNDELTFRIARPHDIWLHARGVEGAHGIIRLDKNVQVPSEVIERAATIVAYYSGARTSSYAPVSWTYRKYLRRPRKRQPGTVEMMQEEVVFVTPGVPDASEAIE